MLSNLFSGIAGALIVSILNIIWDKFKQKSEERRYHIRLKHELYLDFLTLLQIPIEKFTPNSQELKNWCLDMERLMPKIAILAEEKFIKDYLNISNLSVSGAENIQFEMVNYLREYYGSSKLAYTDYKKLLNIKT